MKGNFFLKTEFIWKTVLLCCLLVLHPFVSSAQTTDLNFSDGEYFWGISSGYGHLMPIGISSPGKFHISDSIRWNMVSPFAVSNFGRYIISKEPISISVSGSKLSWETGSEVAVAGKTLRQAYLNVMSKHIKPKGETLPPKEFFNSPVYNTWKALGSSLSEGTVKDLASKILNASIKPGIILLDYGWQECNGQFTFDAKRFPNPKELIDLLHSKGFKVMLQVTPLVSLDCFNISYFLDEDMLEKTVDGKTEIISWYGGLSALLDISNEKSIDYIDNALRDLTSQYGIDGYKFDYVHSPSFSNMQNYLSRILPWTKLASGYKYNMTLSSYKTPQTLSVIGHLTYRDTKWSSLQLIVAEALNAGMNGYPFIVPDPVGGGFSEKKEPAGSFDLDLYTRWMQLQTFLPSMQISEIPGTLIPLEKFNKIMELREKINPYIEELSQSAASTGEPIIRSMEYVFPGKGFHDCNDQFMVGTRYLVAPIMTPDGSRTVRIPSGTWVDDCGVKYRGPMVVKIKAPLDRILYFTTTKEPKLK